MDLIGAVPMDKGQQMKIFSHVEPKKFIKEESLMSNRRRIYNMSVIERKEKLLNFVNH